VHSAGPHCGPRYWPADPAQPGIRPMAHVHRVSSWAVTARVVVRWPVARWCLAGDEVLSARTGGGGVSEEASGKVRQLAVVARQHFIVASGSAGRR
jgi:hypothetical protein